MVKILLIYETPTFCQKVDKMIKEECILHKMAVLEIESNASCALADINSFSADYVVLEMREEMALLVRELLVKCCSIPTEKMVDFYKGYHNMLWIPKIQKVMGNPKYYDMKGLIMGLSHGETGIVSAMFPKKTCNIATGGQDIYYNLKSLEWCMEHHKNGLRGIEYVIFDMYDYSYFNLDTSLGKNAVNYYLNWDGYLWDGHHFDDNKNFNYSFTQLREVMERQKYDRITQQEEQNFHFCFPSVLEASNYEEFEDDYKVKNITNVVTEKELEEYVIETSMVKKDFPETKKENLESFEKILFLLNKINPDIKIKIVLMPRCRCIEKRMEPYDKVLKTEFMENLYQMQRKYPFEIFDLKGLEEISSHREYYYDGEHLNRYGAEQFTKYFLEHCMKNVE